MTEKVQQMLVLISFPISHLQKHSYPGVVEIENSISIGERQVHGVVDIGIYLKLLKVMLWILL